MRHPLKCQCGKLEGYISEPELAYRAVCYCKDCQAFAHFVNRADAILDMQGGTGIVATLPRRVHFTQGLEHVRCMSLSDNPMAPPLVLTQVERRSITPS